MTAPSDQLLGGWAPDVSTAGPEWQTATEAQRRDAITAAVRTVWALSGRQFGSSQVRVAPWVPYVAPAHYRGYGRPTVSPYLMAKFDRARRILLPGPVVDVVEVRLGDLVLQRGTEWAMQHGGYLVKREGIWPSQDLNWPTFVVTYTRGQLVPVDGQIAAGHLAEELLKARVGSKTCKLPARTREISRAGVSISVASPEDLSDKGLVGVKPVDDFIVATNPERLTSAPSVWTPELASHRFLEPPP